MYIKDVPKVGIQYIVYLLLAHLYVVYIELITISVSLVDVTMMDLPKK